MIVTDVSGAGNLGSSGGRYVSSLYKKGLGLEFYIASSEAVSDAEIAVSVAYDNALDKPGTLTFNCDEYQVIVNGTPMQFDDFTVVKGEKFSDKICLLYTSPSPRDTERCPCSPGMKITDCLPK